MAEKVALISLGCPKNLVDSEMMLGHLHLSGYELTTDAAEADVIVVNTCGFLGAAAQESVDALLEAAERKKGGKCRAGSFASARTRRGMGWTCAWGSSSPRCCGSWGRSRNCAGSG